MDRLVTSGDPSHPSLNRQDAFFLSYATAAVWCITLSVYCIKGHSVVAMNMSVESF